MCALVWNRTSISCASNRRHHQIGFESKVWPGPEELVFGRCPATGIVDYLIVKDHPRPSPWLLPRLKQRPESFGIRVDLSRSRRSASFAVPRVIGPEMKKAAEVDFTWAAFARTYE